MLLVFTDSYRIDRVLVLVQSGDKGACGFEVFDYSVRPRSEILSVVMSQSNSLSTSPLTEMLHRRALWTRVGN